MQTDSENTGYKKTILWVDDEDIVLEVWSQTFQKFGYTVLQARYGYEALNIFEKKNSEISLVILDLRMPGMDGCEVYDRLKVIQKEIKIIIVSRYIDQYYIDELLKRNFGDYIEKPFKLKELSEKIEKVLAQP
jgi:CheY-like chemotaxis protein